MTQARDLEELYAASYSRLVGVLTLVAADRLEAEDVVQEAFIKLMRHWQKVRYYDDPEAWVRAVSFRLLSNRRRNIRTGASILRRLVASNRPSVPPPGSDAVDVSAALKRLPMIHRQVLVLHYMFDMTSREIGDTLKISEGTVKSRLGRGRAGLAAILREELQECSM